jgi:hypothetical protein
MKALMEHWRHKGIPNSGTDPAAHQFGPEVKPEKKNLISRAFALEKNSAVIALTSDSVLGCSDCGNMASCLPTYELLSN